MNDEKQEGELQGMRWERQPRPDSVLCFQRCFSYLFRESYPRSTCCTARTQYPLTAIVFVFYSVIRNYHKLGGFKKLDLLSYSSVNLKSSTGLSWIESSLRKDLLLCLFLILEAAYILCLVDSFCLQSLTMVKDSPLLRILVIKLDPPR